MKNQGLCRTCVNDRDCTFPRKLPVWHCEEFSDHEPVPKDSKKNFTKAKIQKSKVEEEETE